MSLQFTGVGHGINTRSFVGSGVMNSLAWSEMALRSTGLSQSLQRTTPRSDLSGSTPKIFMSRAESHDVGGEGSSAICASVGGVL